jgi:hypothetical protein
MPYAPMKDPMAIFLVVESLSVMNAYHMEFRWEWL